MSPSRSLRPRDDVTANAAVTRDGERGEGPRNDPGALACPPGACRRQGDASIDTPSDA